MLKVWKVTAGPVSRLLDRIPSERLQNYLHYNPHDVELAVIPEPPSRRERSRSRTGRANTYEMEEHWGKYNIS